MSLFEDIGVAYIDNGDSATRYMGMKVHMKTNAKLTQLHWINGENAGVSLPFECRVFANDLAFNDSGVQTAGTQVGGTVDFWMDDIANFYADWTDPNCPAMPLGSDRYLVGIGEGGDAVGYVFYPDTGFYAPWPKTGTYLDWTASVWDNGIGEFYLFSVQDVTLELVAADGLSRRTVRIASSPRLTVQRIRR